MDDGNKMDEQGNNMNEDQERDGNIADQKKPSQGLGQGPGQQEREGQGNDEEEQQDQERIPA